MKRPGDEDIMTLHRYASDGRILPRMSLRNRIAFYYTITTALLMAVVFAAILFSIDRIVYLHFDQDLRHEVSEILQEVRLNGKLFSGFEGICELESSDEKSPGIQSSIVRLSVESGFIQLVDPSGQVVSKSINLDRNVLAFNSTYSGVRYFNSTVGRVPVRQVQVPLINKTGTVEAWLIVAIPTRNVMLVLVELKNIMLISFPVIILLLFILTRAIAGRSIRPVDDVIAIAETMTQASLDQRISLPRKHDELYRLSFTINALLDQLQDAFQREKHFTSDASHELRTPLAVVKGTLDVLIRKPRPVEHYEEKIRYCLDELNRMARLIDQLLILARYDQESIKPKTAPIEISSVVESVIARMEQMAGEKQISFVRGNFDPGMVSADLAMLEMIFENIFTNAIKFSHAGSSIEIEVARRTALMVCTITDHGVGIPEEKLQHVFDRFYRVDESRGSSTGGFGLGLSIVRKLADLQQIGVSVTSRENEGTAFRLVFQVA